jgi:cell wall-associated NlpC family hydrolase
VTDAVANLADQITAGGIPNQRAGAATAVQAAQAQLGKPYQWGGAGPDAFDCSGLTAWAWNAVGVVLPHNAAQQDDAVADIPVSAALPGDLLFYGNPDVYHEAIYVGNGQMIEAANSSAPVRLVPVRTQDLENAGRVT